MSKKDQALEQLEELMQTELTGLLTYTQADYKDVQDWAKAIAKDTITVIRKGYTDAPPELMAQALLVAEVGRIRINRYTKLRLKVFLSAAVKVAATLL